MKHFKRKDFACRCGCGFDTVDYHLVVRLDQIREHFNAPTYITGPNRCTARNNATPNSSKNSQHVQGRAADITVDGVSPREVADYAEGLGLSVGRYKTFTHIDTRTNGPARWGHN